MDNTIILSKTFSFGKIAFGGTEATNAVEIDLEYKVQDKTPTPPGILSMCGSVWNSRHTDIVMGGQCLNELVPYIGQDPTFQKLLYLHNLYHLNDLHAGIPRQEQLLKANGLTAFADDYEQCCEFLKEKGCYIIPARTADKYRNPTSTKKGQDSAFGLEWFYWPIPLKDHLKIMSFFPDKE